jgi:diguanylate cyclase (GGDEF)-like protein
MAALLMLLVLAVLAASGLAFYGYLERVIVDSFGKQAEAMASVVAELVESRMGEYRELEDESDAARPVYREMKAFFRRMLSDDFIRFVYTERRISDGKIEYVLDSEDAASPEASPIGQADDLDALDRAAFDSGKAVHGGLVEDPKWGALITGFAPILDPGSGKLVGLAGVDVAARTVEGILSRTRLLILLVAAVIFAVAIIPAFSLSDRVTRQLLIDPLTEAKAKRSILPDLARASARAASAGLPFAVIVLDLDRFKEVNDGFGHQAGDIVLRAAAQAMKAALRYDDRLYRYGGEEFVLIMLGPPEARALQVAELMRKNVESTPIGIEGAGELRVTVSVGVALLARGEGHEELLRRADEAMYEAKRQGRNRVVLASRDPGPPA